jgi:hypothetical protein
MSESNTQERLMIVEFDERIIYIIYIYIYTTHWIVPRGRSNYNITLFDLVYFINLKPKYMSSSKTGNISQKYEKLYKSLLFIDINIFVYCSWVDTRLHTFTHKQYTEQHNETEYTEYYTHNNKNIQT